MPVAVACQCGQRFAAQDHLRGKRVRCPSCGGPLAIPAPPPAAAQAPVNAKGVRVDCACGQAFMASAALQGKAARCPACGGTLHIPPATAEGNDILSVDPLLAMGGSQRNAAVSQQHSPLAARPASLSAASQSLNQNSMLLIGGIVAAAAVALIALVTAVAMSLGGRGQAVASGPAIAGAGNANTNSTAPAPASHQPRGDARPPGAPPAPPKPSFDLAALPTSTPNSGSGTAEASGTGNPVASSQQPSAPSIATSTSGNQPRPSAFQETTPEGGAKVGFLPSSVQAWHAQDNRRLKGLTRVGDSELPFAHYSWMTQLLPFLGHQKEYDRFDFSQPLTDDRNIQVGGEVIPAFLNPLDDRPRWKGYPFEGLALTHFAGMAGIEDSRNVVAGALSRSDPRAGVFGYDEIVRPEEITDGASQTIMIVGTGSLASPWIFGGGATIRGAREPYFDKVSGLGTRNLPQPGTITVMADGAVRFIPSGVDPQVFRAMCTTHGRDSVDLEKASQPFLLESIEK